MSRRKELEKELQIAQDRLDKANRNIPDEVLHVWREEYDSISFELNNLYDDGQDDDE